MRCIVLSTLSIFSILQINVAPSGIRRIIGGRDADEEKYPYIVRVEEENIVIKEEVNYVNFTHICTGAVLTPTWTLSAAHCIYINGSQSFRNVTLSPVIRHGPLKNNSITKVIYAVRHPRYRLRIHEIVNDIGLLKTEKIILKQYARLSALDFTSMIGQESILSGYGVTKNLEGVADDATVLMKPLQMLDVVIVKCHRIHGNKIKMRPVMCVTRRCGESSGICPGDSGGPMLHPVEDGSGVVGVNSVGPKFMRKFCFLELRYPVYDAGFITPTSPYLDWIRDTIIKDESFTDATT